MKKNILIVDNDQLVLYGLSKLLQKESLEVSIADSGTKAVEKLGASSFDICLLDIHMKDINGVELVKTVKNLCPTTRVIVMTAGSIDGNDPNNNIKAAAENGACHFITKPFELPLIRETVLKVLKDEKSAEDESFSAGFRFGENIILEKRRKFERSPLQKQITFFMSVIDRGETKRWSLAGNSLDISEGGLGILTKYSLKSGQVISFGEELENKTGVVAWSILLDDNTCRAGIKFV